MKRVNVFIVGAAKSGTSSLADFFSGLLEFSVSNKKEPNYFSADMLNAQKIYYVGDSRITNEKTYLKTFDVSKKYLVDASVSYSSYPDIPEKIKVYNPNAKIIILIRNPIDRAYSHFSMDKRAGYIHEDLEFMDIFELKHKYPLFFQQVFELSFYYENISRYIYVFGKSNVKVINFENLLCNQNNVLSELLNWIGCQSSNYSEELVLPKKNEYVKPKLSFFNLCTANPSFMSSLKKIVPQRPYFFIKRMLMASAIKPVLSLDSKMQLQPFFENDMCNIENLLNISLDGWRL